MGRAGRSSRSGGVCLAGVRFVVREVRKRLVAGVDLGERFALGGLHGAGAADPHLAALALPHRPKVGVEDVHAGPRHRSADRERAARVVLHERVDDRDLGGTARVEESMLSSPLVSQGLRAAFSGDDDGACRAPMGGERGENAGRGDQDVDALRGGGDVRAADHQRAAVHECAEHLPHGHVEGDVEHLPHACACRDAEVSGSLGEEVDEVAVTHLHAVGDSGGPGGEDDSAGVGRRGCHGEGR